MTRKNGTEITNSTKLANRNKMRGKKQWACPRQKKKKKAS